MWNAGNTRTLTRSSKNARNITALETQKVRKS